MFRFLFGVTVGAGVALYMQNRQNRAQLEARMRELQGRTNAVVEESRRILDETKGELSQALEAGRENVQHKADRLRSAATTGHGTPGGMTREAQQ